MEKMVKYTMVQNVTTKGPRYFQVTGTGSEYSNATFFPKRALRTSTTMSPSQSAASVTNFSAPPSALNDFNDGDMDKTSPVVYFVVPLLLLVGLIGVSIMIWTFIQKRKKWDDLRHTLVPRAQRDVDTESASSTATQSTDPDLDDALQEPVELRSE